MGPVSQLLHDYKAGDSAALAKLFELLWGKLVGLARSRLKTSPLREADEEDVAQSAVVTFRDQIAAGQLADVENSRQLTAWLAVVVTHKVIDRFRREQAVKAGGGKIVSLTPLESLALEPSSAALRDQVADELFEHYVDRLPDGLRRVAKLHLAGHSQEEIARELGCVRWTVMRKLKDVRATWLEMARECGDL
jgi:RNA polymerase sigma factor (sigma-70 family)